LRIEKIKILFLGASPKDMGSLQLDEEVREIEAEIQTGSQRDSFILESKWAVRPKDLRRALLRFKPHIVHFSGHGSKNEEIVLVGNDGHSRLIGKQALITLFKILKDNVRIIVLNSCYSQPQAEALSEMIDYTVGTSRAVRDKSAVAFAAAFYGALAFGRSVQDAFDLAKNEIDLQNLFGSDIPVLLVRKGVNCNVPFLKKIDPDTDLRPSMIAETWTTIVNYCRRARILRLPIWTWCLLAAVSIVIWIIIGLFPGGTITDVRPPEVKITHFETLTMTQGSVELISGARMLEGNFKGKYEGAFLTDFRIFVVCRNENGKFSLWEPTNITQNEWSIPVRFEAPEGNDSARFELSPVVAKERPQVDERIFEEWRQKNGVISLVINVASLVIDAPATTGPYARLSGKARNIPDGTKVSIQTADEGDNHWTPRADVEIRNNRLEAPRVPMRDPNRQGGQVRIRAILSSEEKNVYSREKIVSELRNVTVPAPRVKITHVNRHELVGSRRCPALKPESTVEIRGEAENLLDDDQIWVLVLGEGEEPGKTGIWPPFGSDSVDKKKGDGGRVYWSKAIKLKKTDFTLARFIVKAAASSIPPIGNLEAIREALGDLVECQSRER
jgi:hypothetical protein